MKKQLEMKMLMPLNIQMFATPDEMFWEVMSAGSIAVIADEDPNAFEPMLGDALFPSEKVPGLKLSAIKDSKGIAMALKPSQFDTKAPIRDRMNIEVFEDEMPLFREGMILGERERQNLFEAFNRTPEAYRTILARIYDDRLTLLAGADIQAERMRMQVLSTGKIGITANGEYLDYDFDVPADHFETLTGTDVWTDPNADIIALYNRAKKTVRLKTGRLIERAYMNSNTFEKLLKNNQVKEMLKIASPLGSFILEDDVRSYLERATKVSIVIYDKVFMTEDGKTEQLYPDGVVTFAVSGPLGRTNYGTTPEEFDLLNSPQSGADVAIVNTGVAITTYKQIHPVNSKTIVSQIVLPSFEQANNIYIANVYTP